MFNSDTYFVEDFYSRWNSLEVKKLSVINTMLMYRMLPLVDSVKNFNCLSSNPTKWSNTLKQVVGNLPTNCLSVFDHFVGLVRKGLTYSKKMLMLSNFRPMFSFHILWKLPKTKAFLTFSGGINKKEIVKIKFKKTGHHFLVEILSRRWKQLYRTQESLLI